MSLNLDEQIRTVTAQLSAGANPRTVLENFATTIRSNQGECVTERKVYACLSCGTPDVRCPPCMAKGIAQEKILPAVLGKLAEMREQRAAPAPPPPRPGPPPPPSGPQRF